MPKSVSLTASSGKGHANKSPTKTNAKQAKGDGKFGGMDLNDSESRHGPREKMSVGVSTTMHGKAVGGHPEHCASEFSGKGKGFMTDCG